MATGDYRRCLACSVAAIDIAFGRRRTFTPSRAQILMKSPFMKTCHSLARATLLPLAAGATRTNAQSGAFVAMHPNPSPATREWDQYLVLDSQFHVVARFVR